MVNGLNSNKPNATSIVSSSSRSLEVDNVSSIILKYISEVLMDDEDLQTQSYMSHDSLALQATEKSLYEVLDEKHPLPENGNSSIFHENVGNPLNTLDTNRRIENSLANVFMILNNERQAISQRGEYEIKEAIKIEESDHGIIVRNSVASIDVRVRRCYYSEDAIFPEIECCSKKRIFSGGNIIEQPCIYDKFSYLDNESLISRSEETFENGKHVKAKERLKGTNNEKQQRKRQCRETETIDLMPLLQSCAQSVANNDMRNTNELIRQVRQHASVNGNGMERLAHYVVNALEARLVGTGTISESSFSVQNISARSTIKAFTECLKACPFPLLSYYFANKSILKQVENKNKLHIIDFGITNGFQWPHLIEHLSERPGGPPSVRITGIDFPQSGFRPEERDTGAGRRLAYYCRKFGVPFEYNGIAKEWDTIKLENIHLQKDEVIVVNCMYWLRCVPDETLKINSPRDAVLGLIRAINPDLFVHGIVNGNYNAPFFLKRFKEALTHGYAGFDMFDTILPRDHEGRMLFEREVFGRIVMSVIACEGNERIVRPETYRQWQIRNVRAGFEQVPLDREIIENAKAKVKTGYHEDFLVDEDGNWMLQGWKGRTLMAISSWKPSKEFKC